MSALIEMTIILLVVLYLVSATSSEGKFLLIFNHVVVDQIKFIYFCKFLEVPDDR